jgi:hypothetical protein
MHWEMTASSVLKSKEGATMREILLSMVLVVSTAGVARAQQTTGDKAEEAKKEVMKIELDKAPILLSNGDATAEWHNRINDPSGVNLTRGRFLSNEEEVKLIRSGETHMLANKQYDHKVVIYNNGTVAMVTYVQDAVFRRDGKPVPLHALCMNIYIKFDDGRWQRIAHVVEPAAETTETK